MKQARLISALEACINTAVGYFASLVLWYVAVIPILGIERSTGQAFGITALFTAVSLARGYIIRRFFETRFQRVARTVAGWLDGQ